jgi:preprotein translocase subunit YajC
VGTAWAQTAEGGPPPIFNLLPLVAVAAILYVLLVRPEQKRRKDHEQLVAGLKRNDQITMSSGIHGRVVAIGDKVVTVEIAPKVQVVVDRVAVQTVETASGVEAREKEREKS